MDSTATFSSAWVDAKFRHANDLLRSIDVQVKEFNDRQLVLAKPHQVDEFTYEFRLSIGGQPPIEEWSLILGDALHNLRSALDTLAWELANLERAPKHPTKIYYPLATDEDDWSARWAPVLESVPDVYLERMKNTQSFSGGTAKQALRDLHQLDIADKHMGLLRAEASIEEFPYELDLQVGDGITPVDGTLTPLTLPNASDFVEGNAMFGHRADVALQVRGPQSINVPVIPALYLDGSKYRALQFASQLSVLVALTIDRVCLGEDEAINRAINAGVLEVLGEQPVEGE